MADAPPLAVGLRLLEVDVRLSEPEVRLLEIGIRLLEIGIRLLEIGIRLLELGIRLLELGVRLSVAEMPPSDAPPFLSSEKLLTIIGDRREKISVPDKTRNSSLPDGGASFAANLRNP